jgi:hypothetical protein
MLLNLLIHVTPSPPSPMVLNFIPPNILSSKLLNPNLLNLLNLILLNLILLNLLPRPTHLIQAAQPYATQPTPKPNPITILFHPPSFTLLHNKQQKQK